MLKSKIRFKKYNIENKEKTKIQIKTLYKFYKIEKTSKLIASFHKKYQNSRIKELDKKNLKILLENVILLEKK